MERRITTGPNAQVATSLYFKSLLDKKKLYISIYFFNIHPDLQVTLPLILYIFVNPGEEMAHDPELIKRQVTENFAKEFPKLYLNIVQHSDLSIVSWAPLILEDAVVLGRHIEDLIIRNKKLVAGDQVAEALEKYGKERRRRFYKKIFDGTNYDCGKLPTSVSSSDSELDNDPKKIN